MTMSNDENYPEIKANGSNKTTLQTDSAMAGQGPASEARNGTQVSRNGNGWGARAFSSEEGPPEKAKPAKGRHRSPDTVEIPVVEPWPEPVDGAALLDAIFAELKRFAVYPKWAAEMLTLWILHTFAFHLRDLTTYVGIESPEKECGKSTLLTVLSRFVNRPAVSSNISSSAFYRVISEWEPTLLIDEGDTNLRGKDDLIGTLNAGYTRETAYVLRVCYDLPEGKEGKKGGEAGTSSGRVARFSSWGPKAIAAIGRLHPTLASRCIVIRMQRKTANEECQRLKFLKSEELKQKCARFVADHAEEIRKAEPQAPAELTNRAADIWEPLLALADLVGGQWPELGRQAACGLTAGAEERSPIGALLLDIWIAFIQNKAERLFSRDVLMVLNERKERPWQESLRGKAPTERWLAAQLEPYGIRPSTTRIGQTVAKGYQLESFKDAFKRYISEREKREFLADAAAAEEAEQHAKEQSAQQAQAAAAAQPAPGAEGVRPAAQTESGAQEQATEQEQAAAEVQPAAAGPTGAEGQTSEAQPVQTQAVQAQPPEHQAAQAESAEAGGSCEIGAGI